MGGPTRFHVINPEEIGDACRLELKDTSVNEERPNNSFSLPLFLFREWESFYKRHTPCWYCFSAPPHFHLKINIQEPA